MAADGRYSRNELLFGAEGQGRIAAAKVGVAGLGGLGSHIAQQLAYLGVVDYVLVDDDEVTESSLNRLIGATPDDTGTKKVAVVKRSIERIQPEAEVLPISAKLPVEEVFDGLGDRSHIFGCFDHETPRLQLTDFTSERKIVYIDLSSDVERKDEYGGRIVVARGDGCLSCLGEIDQEELRREALTPEQRRGHDETYGVRDGALDETGPAVVSVNGVVASLAVNEFMVNVTGLTEPIRYLICRGRMRGLTRWSEDPEPGCPYCARWS